MDTGAVGGIQTLDSPFPIFESDYKVLGGDSGVLYRDVVAPDNSPDPDGGFGFKLQLFAGTWVLDKD